MFNIKILEKRIKLLDNYRIFSNSIILINDKEILIKYDKNSAPYNQRYLISISDDNNERLTIVTQKRKDLLGIGIDVIHLNKNYKIPKRLDLFYEKEIKNINSLKSYLKIVSIKEACFKSISNILRKEEMTSNIFEFEINEEIIAHGNGKEVLNKYQARLEYEMHEIDNYLVCLAICIK